MNRNTWIIIIVAVIVIIGLIWIFNKGTPAPVAVTASSSAVVTSSEVVSAPAMAPASS